MPNDVLDPTSPPASHPPGNAWYKGMPRVGGGRKKGSLASSRQAIRDYILELERVEEIETAQPGKWLIYVMATGKDPRFRLRGQKFKFQSQEEALTAGKLAIQQDKPIEIPVEGRDYPLAMDKRVAAAAKVIRYVMPALGQVKITGDNDERVGEDVDTAKKLAAVPAIRDLLEGVQQAMGEQE